MYTHNMRRGCNSFTSYSDKAHLDNYVMKCRTDFGSVDIYIYIYVYMSRYTQHNLYNRKWHNSADSVSLQMQIIILWVAEMCGFTEHHKLHFIPSSATG